MTETITDAMEDAMQIYLDHVASHEEYLINSNITAHMMSEYDMDIADATCMVIKAEGVLEYLHKI